MRNVVLTAILVSACGSSNNAKGADASVDTPHVPPTITVSGTASERGLGGSTPVAGAVVAAYKSSDETNAVAMATTDAMGKYSLTITTNGAPLDGFVMATKSGYVDNYLYPPAPLIADFAQGSVNMLTPTTFGYLFSFSGVTQVPGNGQIALEVVDAAMATVAGAMVSSTPAGTYRYNGTNGLPDKNATMTQMDGIAFILNVPAGKVTLSATGTGTFKSHSLNAHGDKFTTTVITK
jgi:hypothetical protein